MSDKATKSSVKKPAVKTVLQKQSKPQAPNTTLSSNPSSAAPALTRDKVLALQRTAGNDAVQRLLAQHDIQAKLTVGPANDHYEQEADRVAEQVMAQPSAPTTSVAQREALPEEEEKPQDVQTKRLASGISSLAQRETLPEEEEKPKNAIQSKRLVAQREALPEEEEKPQDVQTKRLASGISSLAQRETLSEEEEKPKDAIQSKRLVAQREALPEEEEKPKVQTKRLASGVSSLAQRETLPEEEEKPKDAIQSKRLVAQREVLPEEDEKQKQIQSKAKLDGDGFEADADFEERLNATQSEGKPLPEPTRKFMESRFGVDFSAVRIHTGNEAIELTRQIGAQAFTRGVDIYLGAGKEDIESTAGKELLAHELTHVVQQTGGGKAIA